MNVSSVKFILKIKNNKIIRKAIKPVMNKKREKELRLYANSDDSRRLEAFKDKYYGEECYIIGNGPSLTIADLEKLSGKYTFGANRIYTLFDKTTWRPTFYTCVDPEAYKLFGDRLNNIDAKHLFFDIIAKKYIRGQVRDNVYFIYQYAPFTDNRWDSTHPFISEDVTKMISMGMTVTFVAIQLAIYMGFKKIYLLGVDHNYARQVTKDGTIIEDKSKKSYGAGIVDSGVGLQYTDTTTEAYQAAQSYCESHDVKIYNATRGGKLEIFPRINLEETFNK